MVEIQIHLTAKVYFNFCSTNPTSTKKEGSMLRSAPPRAVFSDMRLPRGCRRRCFLERAGQVFEAGAPMRIGADAVATCPLRSLIITSLPTADTLEGRYSSLLRMIRNPARSGWMLNPRVGNFPRGHQQSHVLIILPRHLDMAPSWAEFAGENQAPANR